MSRIKKLIVAVLCVVLAVTASLLVFAACDKDETGYKVTLNYNKDQGSVTVSAPAEGKLYDANERVTVTVTPNADYQVAAFTVNGTAQNLTDGTTYAFDITADTTIAVTFEEKQKPEWSKYAGIFDDGEDEPTVEVTIAENGDVTVRNGEQTVTATASQIVFSHESNEETSYDQLVFTVEEIEYSIYVIDEDTITIMNDADDDNWLMASLYRQGTHEDVDPTPTPECEWEQYIGVFESDPYEDEIMEQAHVILTITAESLTLQLENASPITVWTDDIEFSHVSDDYFGEYDQFVFIVDDVTYYISSYNVDMLAVANDVYDDSYLSANVYRNGSHGGESEWEQFIGTWVGTFDDITETPVVLEVTSDEIKLTIGEDGPFKALEIEVGSVGSLLKLTFTVDGEQYTLTEGVDASTIRLQNSDFDTAELTLQSEDPDEPIEWPTAWDGTFTGEATDGTSYTIEITRTGITVAIDNFEYNARIISFNDYSGFTIEFNDTTYGIAQNGYGDEIDVIDLYEEDNMRNSVTLTRQAESLGIPQGYIGNWTGVIEDLELNIKLVVSDTGIQITEGDDTYNATNIKVNSDSVTFNRESGSFDYTLTIISTGLHLKRELSSFTWETDLAKDSGDEEPTCEWEYYIGTYRGYDGSKLYTIIIDEDGITINDGSMSLQKVVIVEYYGDTEGFKITVNGETRMLQDKSYAEEHSLTLWLASEDYKTFSLDLVRAADADELIYDLTEIAGTWTGTENVYGVNYDYTLVIHSDGTGEMQWAMGSIFAVTYYDVHFELINYHLVLSYKEDEDASKCYYMILYYDYELANLNVLVALNNGSLTLTKTAGGDEDEPAKIPDKFIGEYSTTGYEVTITADSITITVKGTYETPDITETVTNIKVEGDTITCTFYGDTCTITAIGDGDKAQQITLQAPNFGTRNLNRKAESGGDSDLTEESFYGTFEGSDSIGDYVLEISADGITFTITLKTEHDAPTTAKGENVSFVDGAIHFKISGAMEVIVTNASQGDTITKIHVECSYMELSADLTRTTAGDDDTDLTEESFYGTFEGTDGSSITITAEGVTSFNVPDIGEFSGTSHEFDAATGTYKFTANGNDFTITAKSNDNPITQILIHHVQNQLGDMTLTRKAEEEEPACEWTEYIGTWSYTEDYVESEDEVYTVVISEDGFEVSCCDVSFTVEAKDITFDPETGFTWTHEGLEYTLEIYEDGSLKFYDESYEIAPEVFLSREA